MQHRDVCRVVVAKGLDVLTSVTKKFKPFLTSPIGDEELPLEAQRVIDRCEISRCDALFCKAWLATNEKAEEPKVVVEKQIAKFNKLRLKGGHGEVQQALWRAGQDALT